MASAVMQLGAGGAELEQGQVGEPAVDPGGDLLARGEQVLRVADLVQGRQGRAPVLAGHVDDGLLDPAQGAQPGGVALGADVVEHRERLVASVQGEGRPGQGDEQPGARRRPAPRSSRRSDSAQGAAQRALGVTEPADLVEVAALGPGAPRPAWSATSMAYL